MKKIILTIAILFSAIPFINAQESSEKVFDLTIEISGFSSNEGNALIAVYNKEGDFLKKGFRGGISKITNKKVIYTFKGIPKGEYAVSMFHDENDNKKMDSNFFGIPKEDYGCSNDASGFMGPPKYEDAKFQLTENKTIKINM